MATLSSSAIISSIGKRESEQASRKAEIAWRLAKRYAQDEPLDWGVAADAPMDDRTRLKEVGHTLLAKKKRKAS